MQPKQVILSIKVSSNDEVTSQARQKSREWTPKDMGRQAATGNWQRWCVRDMARQSVPRRSSRDGKSSITDDWQPTQRTGICSPHQKWGL